MKLLTLLYAALVGSLLGPAVAASGDYGLYRTEKQIIEICGEEISVYAQPAIFTRIYYFAVDHYGVEHSLALEFSEACIQTDDPKTCAALAARETGFVPAAIGKMGERSAWQLLDPPAGLDPLNNFAAAREAMNLFAEKKQEARGSLRGGIRRYNGCGAKARRYANEVLELRRQI